MVEDVLSRQQINITNDNDSDRATIHSEISLTHAISSPENPINCYRNQIVIEEAEQPSIRTFIIFGKKQDI